MPPVIIVALGAFGAAALAKFLARESRRVNTELDETRRTTANPEVDGKARPTLHRDPKTGEYRPHNS